VSGYVLPPEVARFAPAAVCRLASWLVRLRKLAADDPALKAKVGHLLGPLPYEAEFLSGDIGRVERAIGEVGSVVPRTGVEMGTSSDPLPLESPQCAGDKATTSQAPSPKRALKPAGEGTND
jgi:hypothetical protein